jgi:hypothetical protein
MPANALYKPVRLLAAAARTTDFWTSIARHSVPVIGVWAFGWSPVNLAVFFLLESWLFITTRLTIEVTFDPHYAGDSLPHSGWDAVGKTAWMFLLAGVACAVLVVGFGGVVLLVALPAGAWQTFVRQGWHQQSFLISLALLALDCVLDGFSFKRRLLRRSESERRADTQRTQLMLYRVGALLLACVVLMVAAEFGVGGRVSVLVIMIILVVVDTFPRHVIRYFYGPGDVPSGRAR